MKPHSYFITVLWTTQSGLELSTSFSIGGIQISQKLAEALAHFLVPSEPNCSNRTVLVQQCTETIRPAPDLSNISEAYPIYADFVLGVSRPTINEPKTVVMKGRKSESPDLSEVHDAIPVSDGTFVDHDISNLIERTKSIVGLTYTSHPIVEKVKELGTFSNTMRWTDYGAMLAMRTCAEILDALLKESRDVQGIKESTTIFDAVAKKIEQLKERPKTDTKYDILASTIKAVKVLCKNVTPQMPIHGEAFRILKINTDDQEDLGKHSRKYLLDCSAVLSYIIENRPNPKMYQHYEPLLEKVKKLIWKTNINYIEELDMVEEVDAESSPKPAPKNYHALTLIRTLQNFITANFRPGTLPKGSGEFLKISSMTKNAGTHLTMARSICEESLARYRGGKKELNQILKDINNRLRMYKVNLVKDIRGGQTNLDVDVELVELMTEADQYLTEVKQKFESGGYVFHFTLPDVVNTLRSLDLWCPLEMSAPEILPDLKTALTVLSKWNPKDKRAVQSLLLDIEKKLKAKENDFSTKPGKVSKTRELVETSIETFRGVKSNNRSILDKAIGLIKAVKEDSDILKDPMFTLKECKDVLQGLCVPSDADNSTVESARALVQAIDRHLKEFSNKTEEEVPQITKEIAAKDGQVVIVDHETGEVQNLGIPEHIFNAAVERYRETAPDRSKSILHFVEEIETKAPTSYEPER